MFVETVGGDLTIKVENNTDSGRRHLRRAGRQRRIRRSMTPKIHYAVLGNLVLLKDETLPGRRRLDSWFTTARFSKRCELDEIEEACVMLPGDQGLIFPGGYYLQTGEFKRFETGLKRHALPTHRRSLQRRRLPVPVLRSEVGYVRPIAIQPDQPNRRNTADLPRADVL